MEAARSARIDDGEQVAAMRREAREAVTRARGGLQMAAERAANDVAWVRWIGDPDRLAVVGTFDGHVVGYGLAHLATVGAGELLGVVDEVWTQPEARGVGVAEAVMEAILDWCRHAGCSGADAEALPGDRVMKGFFERYGMSARLLVMHRGFGAGAHRQTGGGQ